MSLYLFPVAFFDPPQVFDSSVTNIPGSGSAPLQVIANTGMRAAHAINYIDATDDYIGVYVGPVGQEVFYCIIGGGVTSTQAIVIPAFSRVSLRSMSASPITNGKLMCVFLGCLNVYRSDLKQYK